MPKPRHHRTLGRVPERPAECRGGGADDRRAKECHSSRAPGQQVFGIVQGGNDAALREACARELVAMDFDGYAIDTASIGEPEPEMMQAIEFTEPFRLPAGKALLPMGLGTPLPTRGTGRRNVDMFDCVLPTRVATTALPSRRLRPVPASEQGSTRRISGPSRKAVSVMRARDFSAPTSTPMVGEFWAAHGERAQLPYA